MSAINGGRVERGRARMWLGVGIAVIPGVVAGFLGAIFGPFRIMLGGGILIAASGILVLVLRDRTWTRVVLTVGVALVFGACAYVLLGLVMPQGTGSGSGSGCAPGGTCQP
ncbi:hypothetical protein LXM50_14895 [Microbacterium sp. Au-Mic1]|uniref:hypothetical protein n=1 Tax=Microbacterium sp. Au-Mic1 TaxID=2906457 RepID=UPI001E31FE9C|nr:hypothetical protein [Microbacterium sp. Au-Mic1]MCE4027260.1 hypothetical protein [Microbacterium sp. Au-Mic1]